MTVDTMGVTPASMATGDTGVPRHAVKAVALLVRWNWEPAHAGQDTMASGVNTCVPASANCVPMKAIATVWTATTAMTVKERA